MKIKELFVNEIDRYIDPVIKIEDEIHSLQELEEYVVTDKIAENLIKFFEKFNETALHERKDIGVWISGFFGSDKSHFAKILGYLLENKHIDGRTSRDIFKNRIKGLENSDDLLLELQTLSEDFGRIGLGRIWLIITSQEKLDQVIEGVKIKQEGYKKIMDRFETKLDLTSENIVAVLEERILKKKETAIPEISSIYSKYQGAIAYASKLEGANRPLIECTNDNFITSYPFLPYQLEITQHIFANIRSLAGHSSKLTGAERSMLGVTQGILKSPETRFKTSDIGRFISFDEIFDQIRTEISGDIQRDINEIKIPEKGDIKLSRKAMKTLFLLQQLRWIPKTLTNISRATVDSSDVNIASYEKDVKAALDILIKGKYVIFDNGQYEYISGAKKLIEEEISIEPVKSHEIKRFASDILTSGITKYPEAKCLGRGITMVGEYMSNEEYDDLVGDLI